MNQSIKGLITILDNCDLPESRLQCIEVFAMCHQIPLDEVYKLIEDQVLTELGALQREPEIAGDSGQ